MENLLKDSIVSHGENNIFDIFQEKIEYYHERPSHTIVELKSINTKSKGDLFEKFCRRYLEVVCKYDYVYLLKELPDNIRTHLNLNKNDFGIDIVAIKDNLFYPVQCKWRSINKKYKSMVTWKQLSTFYALCSKTGPWNKKIVMTCCDYVRKIGNSKDEVWINKEKFRKITISEWYTMANMEEKKLNDVGSSSNGGNSGSGNNGNSNPRPSIDELRELRLKALSL